MEHIELLEEAWEHVEQINVVSGGDIILFFCKSPFTTCQLLGANLGGMCGKSFSK